MLLHPSSPPSSPPPSGFLSFSPSRKRVAALGNAYMKTFPSWCQAHGLPLLCDGAEPQCHKLSQAAVCWSPLADRQGGSCRFPQRSPRRTPPHHISPFTLHTHTVYARSSSLVFPAVQCVFLTIHVSLLLRDPSVPQSTVKSPSWDS